MVAARGPLTRRTLLGAGAVAAVAAGGCGDRTPKPPPGGDPAVLAGLLAVERELVGAWDAASALPGSRGATGRAVLGQERAHAQRLEGQVRAAGGAAVPEAPAELRAAAEEVRARAGEGDAAGAMRAALALEREAQRAYISGVALLAAGEHRALAMAIGADEAGHASAVLAALARDPVPDPFAGTARA